MFSRPRFRALAFLVLAALSFASTAQTVDGAAPSFTWHHGAQRKTAWLSETELGVLLHPHRAAPAVAIAQHLQREGLDGRLVRSRHNVMRYRLAERLTSQQRNSLQKQLGTLDALRTVSPLFYTRSDLSGEPRILSGEMIIGFRPDWQQDRIDAWLSERALGKLRTFPYAPHTWLVNAGDAMRSLALSEQIYQSGEVAYAYPNWLSPAAKRNDPLYPSQFHLENTGQNGGTPGVDLNVASVWTNNRASSNEVVCIVDDAVEISHEDLSANVVAGLSWDSIDLDGDPEPEAADEDHGTSVAGLAVARGFNGLGVRGAAPEAGLAAIRYSYDFSEDAATADVLSHSNQQIDIYSASWGPLDAFEYLQGPGPLTEASISNSTYSGRQGLGCIYVWAAGNGHVDDTTNSFSDNANYDGFANSRYTIAVGASDDRGVRASYSERGANLLVNAPSDDFARQTVYTTDLMGSPGESPENYTTNFGGTSAVAPMGAGVAALLLNANPSLTWRDVQHILLTTATKNDPTHTGWTTNAAGYPVNHDYGFGRINAGAAIAAATSWVSARPEVLHASPLAVVNIPVPDANAVGVSHSISVTTNITVEFVDVFFSANDHPYWADLQVELVSPAGTRSVLAEAGHGGDVMPYDNWRFGTVRHFGEQSTGRWTLVVKDLESPDAGTFQSWGLRFYGTEVGAAELEQPVFTSFRVNDHVVFQWSNMQEAASYRLEGTTTFPTGFVVVADGIPITAYTDTVSSASSYTYRVFAQ